MSSRVVAFQGVGFGSRAMATQGFLWEDFLDLIEGRISVKLVAELDTQETVRVSGLAPRLSITAHTDAVIKNLILKRPEGSGVESTEEIELRIFRIEKVTTQPEGIFK